MRWQTYAVSTLVALFGSASWISVNSVWVELSLMVNVLPEKWQLPSYLSIIVQLACIGPIAYGVVEKLFRSRISSTLTIYGMLIVACIATVCLALVWNVTTDLGGTEHSVALFATFFVLALVDCTANVLFLPYMMKFKPSYVTSYFIGMGLSALIPSVLALIQGAGHVRCVPSNTTSINNVTSLDNGSAIAFISTPIIPAFNVQIFNFLIFLFLCTALAAFFALNRLPFAIGERAPKHVNVSSTDGEAADAERRPLSVTADDAPKQPTDEPVKQQPPAADDVLLPQRAKRMSTVDYLVLLSITAWVCALMNGVLPSIQSFAALPYGQTTFHLCLALSSIANPIGCFLTFWLGGVVQRAIWRVCVLVGVVSAVCCVILVQAASSPTPFLVGTTSGTVLTILLWFIATGLLAFIRTLVATILRTDSGRHRGLFWCGAASQAGSFVGAVVFFPLINFSNLFKSSDVCSAAGDA